ncbi:MAG: hypothetical protein ACPHRO_08260 [Nannocystaceae bacterium]
MLPPEVYKVLHLLGVAWLFFALGGATLHALNGGDKASNTHRKLMAASHGIALLISLVAGFGMLGGKKMGMWVHLKSALWLALGASLTLVQRKPGLAKIMWFVLPLLAAAGAYLAVYKPG